MGLKLQQSGLILVDTEQRLLNSIHYVERVSLLLYRIGTAFSLMQKTILKQKRIQTWRWLEICLSLGRPLHW